MKSIIVMFMRAGAVLALAAAMSPEVLAQCGWVPVNVWTGCGNACGCQWQNSSINCTPGATCAATCSVFYCGG